MKKVSSIFFALVVVVSMMHVSIAMHFCRGEIAQVKVSLSRELGSCGMENENNHKSLPAGLSNHCCDNKLSVFTIEDSYSYENYQPKDLRHNQIIPPFILLPESVSLFSFQLSDMSSFRPPGNDFIYSVYLPFICVFRN